jgi:hypothetical protein
MRRDCQASNRVCLSHRAVVDNNLGAPGSEVGNFGDQANFLLRSNYPTYAAEKAALTDVEAIELILQLQGLFCSFHPSSTCGTCGNPYQCSRHF